MSLAGLRVLSLESRRAREIEALIRRQGGDPFVAPSVREQPLEDHSGALRFLDQLETGDFDMVVCMTGVGLAFLRDAVVAHAPVERLAGAMRRVTIVARGPKPMVVLRELAVPVHIAIPEPNTWKEILAALRGRPERRIAILEYGRPNQELYDELQALGASVTPVQLYRWELPAGLEPLREAARRLAGREIDVVLFTSSIQLDHLLDIARSLGLEDELRRALRDDVVVASVGPVMTAALASYGLAPDITPEHPKMGALVAAAAGQARDVLARKRATA